jgi:hypothetical protein
MQSSFGPSSPESKTRISPPLRVFFVSDNVEEAAADPSEIETVEDIVAATAGLTAALTPMAVGTGAVDARLDAMGIAVGKTAG